MMRLTQLTFACLFATALVVVTPRAVPAQSPATADPAFAVPTTKILAIGSFTPSATPAVWKPLVREEMRQTAQLYLAGKIDQWYVKPDQTGVVFILNLTDPREAHELLEKLPLGVAGLMAFQLIPLGPLSPMRTLLAEPSK